MKSKSFLLFVVFRSVRGGLGFRFSRYASVIGFLCFRFGVFGFFGLLFDLPNGPLDFDAYLRQLQRFSDICPVLLGEEDLVFFGSGRLELTARCLGSVFGRGRACS